MYIVLNNKNKVSLVKIIPLQLPGVVLKPNIVNIPLIPINSIKLDNSLYAISKSIIFQINFFFK